ncbi:MAG: AbrB/MazE/SpoVT family DNA-binding domain-containing protein [Candidatus Woesearchaeota archaeon]
MDVSITKISSKGQIVLPLEMRKDMTKGEKILIIKNKDQIIMKKAKNLDKNLEEDLEFAKKTNKAWEEISKGKSKEIPFDKFIEEIEKW